VPIPHWVPALGDKEEPPPGGIAYRVLENRRLLLCRTSDEIFAIAAACSQNGAKLEGSILKGYTLNCPSHPGCYYDV
jgi:nitrite reductase/ring-hydroxylating ferredoxin subunit